MARTLMVVRQRDLDAFVHADERDVRVLDYPEGFQLVCYGTLPERRQMIDAAYGFLMLRNGVTIGYVLFERAPWFALIGSAFTVTGAVFLGGVFAAWLSFAALGSVTPPGTATVAVLTRSPVALRIDVTSSV